MTMDLTPPPGGALPKVTLGITLYGHIPALCTLSMVTLAYDGLNAGIIHQISGSVGMAVSVARNEVCRNAINAGSTHVWFVDQDMIVPDGTLPRLLAHDAQVVSGLYFDKVKHRPVAFNWDPMVPIDELPVDRDTPITVGGTGLGCALVRVTLLKAMSLFFGDGAWFGNGENREDIHFAKRCREMGVPILLDAGIVCGHVRDEVITEDHYWAMRELRASIGG